MATKNLQNLLYERTVSENELSAFVPIGPQTVPPRYLRREPVGINETDVFQYVIRMVSPSDFYTPEDFSRRFYIDAHAGRAYAIGNVPVTMRTLTGLPTPGYPVGVISNANKYLGQASSDAQYAQVWNTDAQNAALGVLSATATPLVFSLSLSTSNLAQAVPTLPTSVIGHRYFQFDIVAGTLVDVAFCPLNSFIDFGNATPIQFIDASSVNDYVVSGNVKPNKFFRQQFAPGQKVGLWTRAGYETYDPALYFTAGQGLRGFGYQYAASGTYTITVYHPEGDFFWYNDSTYGGSTAKMANLRGNFPANTRVFSPQGTTQATMNTWASLNLAEWKNKLEYFGYRNEGSSNVSNMGAFVLKDFQAIRILDLTWQSNTAIPITQLTGGSLDIGATWPNLVSLCFSGATNYVVGIDLSKCFKLKEFFFVGNTNSPNEIDNYWMALANCMNISGGRVKIFNTRTAASNAAYAALMAKGISVYSY